MSEEAITKPEQKGGKTRFALMLLPLVLFAALAAIFLAQLTSGRDASTIPSVLIGKSISEFTLPELPGLSADGEPVPGLKSADFAGKVTIVNVWASWCVPCRSEHPALLDLSKDRRIAVVGINYKDKAENARRFLGRLGNPFDAVGIDPKGRAAIDWGVYGIPETFVVGPDRTIRYKHVGPLDVKGYEKLKQEIDKVAAETAG